MQGRRREDAHKLYRCVMSSPDPARNDDSSVSDALGILAYMNSIAFFNIIFLNFCHFKTG